ncbi:sulfurtransferase [Microvirga pudoricolor]|uniref:sulfurtransferase n=1 Tax=Microvirga pudoricolor TaxID=2778729 RepID=UPI00194E8BA0|nr:sulfurtransferase [Microvirga pudoricolor]MBM6596633.1 sulfurtransferase [Microvirga pudoricolor]
MNTLTSHATRTSVLISTTELEAVSKSKHLVLLDIRFRPDSPDGRPAYLAGHIPGAVYVDLPTELAGASRGLSGRRPLPDISDLQRDARQWGVNPDSTVVVYDDNRGLQAARAWWVLRWAGLTDVRLLDGGLAAWKEAGGIVTRDVPQPTPGDVVLAGGHLPVLDADAAASLARSSILLDARGAEAYLGRPREAGKEPEGHIPGAISAPTTENLDAAGLLTDPSLLRKRFAALGIDGQRTVGVYCGGGVAAAHQVLALASLGIEAALFPGSWSAWSADPSRPVATGASPG